MTVQDTVDEDDEAESVNVASIVYRYSSKSTTFCPEPDDDVLEKEQLDRKKDDYPATATDNNSSNGAMKQHHSDVFHDPQQRHHHDDAVEGSVPLYAPPRQRQRWGDEQVAPHTNWGDIFFDLFYVAASYNLGHVLREDPSWTGLLYVVGLLLPIQNLWATKTYYDSRFYYTDDYWHRIYEMALLVALATAVWYIRPVPRLSHPAELHDMFIFSLSITICYFLALGRLVEIMICQKFLPNQTGLHPEAFVATRRDALGNVLTGLLFTAAAVYSGRQFYNHHNNSEHYHADVPSSSPLSHSNTSTSTAPVNHTRHLSSSSYVAETTYVTEPDNIPIWLLLGGTFAAVAWFFQVVVTFSVVHKEKHKE